MINITKQDILKAICQTAKKNQNVPLGIRKFEKETGINAYHIRKFWSTFSEAQHEAGYTPNTLKMAHNTEFLIEGMITLMKEIGRFPTQANLVAKRYRNLEFPSTSSFGRLGDKKEMAKKISEYAEQKGYKDIVELCKPIIKNPNEEKDSDDFKIPTIVEVYLFKSGHYYKIGKTNDTVRRGNEIKVQLPERMDLIHSIKTDDPSGIEAYWHSRFKLKRMQGEWFNLSSTDIKAFKRWRKIV